MGDWRRRQFLTGAAATLALMLIPRTAQAQSITPEQVLDTLISRFPILTGMRIVYAEHPGLSLWPGKFNGVRDSRVIELWNGYSYALYPDALLHECGHALNYWAGIARSEATRLIETSVGPVPWDSVLDDFWRARGFTTSPFASYVDEEVYRRKLQADGVQQFVGDNYYYQFTPSEQFANCFAAVAHDLKDESQLGNFHTATWGVPMNKKALEAFFVNAHRPTVPEPPTIEFLPSDYRGMSVDGSVTVWHSRTRDRNVFFVNGVEIIA